MISLVVFAWVVMIMCVSMLVAAIYPIAWFFVPKPKYQRASSRRRPAEPDQLDAETALYRWLSFLIMYFFWFMLVVSILAYVSLPPRFWSERIYDRDVQVKLDDPSRPLVITRPPITISAAGEVAFLELRLPPEDHDLEPLRRRLRHLSDWREPMVVQPAPETGHLRIMEVLSAIEGDYHLYHLESVLR